MYTVVKPITLAEVAATNPGGCSEFNNEFSEAVTCFIDDYGFYGEIPEKELADMDAKWIRYLINKGFVTEVTNTPIGTYFQRKKTGYKYVLAFSEKFNLLQLVAVCRGNSGRIWNSLNTRVDVDTGVDEATLKTLFGKGKFKQIGPVC